MVQRIITALLIILVVFPPLYLGGVYLDILMVAFITLALYEIVKCLFKPFPKVVFGLLWIVAMFLIFMSNKSYISLFPLLTLVICCMNIAKKEYSIDKMAILFLFMVIFILTIVSIKLVYNVGGGLTMIHIAIATYGTDTGAYFVGRFFGKRKLNERISPNKTIEGSLGGWVTGAVMSIIYGYFFIESLDFVFIVVTSLVMPIVGQIGDLAFSSIKRYVNVKDFGSIFPGHGGVLDRIDSLVFNLIVWMSIYQLWMMFV